MRYAKPLLLGMLLLFAVGCRASRENPTPTPTPAPLPADLASRAADQLLKASSLHFVIELSGRLTYLDSPPTLALKRAEGDLVRPDKVRAKIKISSFGVMSEIGIIGLGDEQYITNPLNQQWERLPRIGGWYFNPVLLFDPERGLESIIGDTAWQFSADGQPEDDGYHRLQGSVSGERISPLTFGMVTSGQVAVEIWVNRTNERVDRLRIVELDSDPEDPTQWLITLSDLGRDVQIKPPPLP